MREPDRVTQSRSLGSQANKPDVALAPERSAAVGRRPSAGRGATGHQTDHRATSPLTDRDPALDLLGDGLDHLLAVDDGLPVEFDVGMRAFELTQDFRIERAAPDAHAAR